MIAEPCTKCRSEVDAALATIQRDFGVPVLCSPCRQKDVGPKPMLFWGPAIGHGDTFGALAEAFITLFTGRIPNLQPKDCITNRVTLRKRQIVGKLLAAGEPIKAYMGHAHCRICGVELGYRDLAGYGFTWPERAEHYVLEHDVWTPDCDRLFAAARKN